MGGPGFLIYVKFWWPLFLALKTLLFLVKSDIFIPFQMYQGGVGGSTGLGIIPKKYQFYLVLPLKGQLRHICLISGLGCHSFADNNQTMLGCILNQNICTPRVICLSVWDAHGQYLRAQLQGEECRFDQKQMSVLTTESVPAQNKSSFSLVEAEFCRSIKAIHFHRERPLNDLTCSEHFFLDALAQLDHFLSPFFGQKI